MPNLCLKVLYIIKKKIRNIEIKSRNFDKKEEYKRKTSNKQKHPEIKHFNNEAKNNKN